jgi:hypothetical protein
MTDADTGSSLGGELRHLSRGFIFAKLDRGIGDPCGKILVVDGIDAFVDILCRRRALENQLMT